MARQRIEQPIAKTTLEQLYVQEKRSMQEIADRMGCSPNKVLYWMNKYGIERRNWSDATYSKLNPSGDPFKIREPQGDAERELFTLGVTLYVGEGTKKSSSVRLANSDPKVIRAFLRFLRETCGVQEKKIKAWLNVFDDVDLNKALAYWRRETGLAGSQFSKSTVRPSRGGNYTNKGEFGTLTIYVSNARLADTIKEWCSILLQRNS